MTHKRQTPNQLIAIELNRYKVSNDLNATIAADAYVSSVWRRGLLV